MRALSVIETGKTYKLGHDYTAEMPLFGNRKFSLRIPGTPTGGAFGANRIMWNDEFLSTEIGQVGTQFDGLGHIGVQVGNNGDKNEMRWYNGFTAAEMGGAYGLQKLGTEKLHPIVARGILIDIAGARGVESMEKGEVVTMDDVQAALKRQGMEGFEFAPGDDIFFRTGWEMHWGNPPMYNDGCPGIGMDVARWIAHVGLPPFAMRVSDLTEEEDLANDDIWATVEGETVLSHLVWLSSVGCAEDEVRYLATAGAEILREVAALDMPPP